MSQNTLLDTSGFIRLPQLLAIFPVSRSAFYAGIKKGIYPAPVKLGRRTSAWRIEDINELMKRLSDKAPE